VKVGEVHKVTNEQTGERMECEVLEVRENGQIMVRVVSGGASLGMKILLDEIKPS
jgi:hypothetical protein